MDDPQPGFDQEFWRSKFTDEERAEFRKNLPRKIHLAISFIIFIGLPLKELLHAIFTIKTLAVASLAGQFIAYHENYAIPFGPSDIFTLWHDRFPACRTHLHRLIVEPCAREIVLKESDAGIKDKSLRISTKALNMDTIRTMLSPSKLATKLRTLAPFTFGLLEVFTTAPNTYRKRKARQAAQDSEDSENPLADTDDEDDTEDTFFGATGDDSGDGPGPDDSPQDEAASAKLPRSTMVSCSRIVVS